MDSRFHGNDRGGGVSFDIEFINDNISSSHNLWGLGMGHVNSQYQMIKRHKKMLNFVVIIAMSFIIFKLIYPTYSWHQKLTVEIETPDGLVSGFSVVQSTMDIQSGFGLPEAGGGVKSWKGEATIVELPSGKYLFVLLGDPVAMAQYSFFEEILEDPKARIKKISMSKIEGLRESRPLLRDRYPLFVTFDDLDDPASVKLVDPDDLAATFGEGYALKSITLEITDEEVTRGEVLKVLDYFWWTKEKREKYNCKAYVCGRNPIRIHFANGTTDALTILDFQRGSKK